MKNINGKAAAGKFYLPFKIENKIYSVNINRTIIKMRNNNNSIVSHKITYNIFKTNKFNSYSHKKKGLYYKFEHISVFVPFHHNSNSVVFF